MGKSGMSIVNQEKIQTTYHLIQTKLTEIKGGKVGQIFWVLILFLLMKDYLLSKEAWGQNISENLQARLVRDVALIN